MKVKALLYTGALATAALTGISSLSAQEATTPAVGYVKETLAANAFNLVGITLHEATLVSGAFETVSGQALTDNDVNFGTTLAANTTYILEITSGPAAGVIQDFTTANVSGNTINTPDNLSTLGLATENTYKIRKAATLSTLFGATNTAGLKAGTSINNADVIWVQNGSGFNKYFYHQGQSTPFPISAGWKTSTLQNASNTSVVYTDGLIIQTQPSSSPVITLTGEVISSSKVIAIQSGFNLVGTVFPVGTTLSASNLQTQLQQGTSINNADVVWMSNGSGGFNKFFYHQGQTNPFPITAGWKTSTLQNASATVIPGAVFIQKLSGSGNITTTPSF